MALLLCGFGSFLGTQVIKAIVFPTILQARVKMFFALVCSYGAAAGLFPHRVADLVIYGAAGAGLGAVIHRFARLLSVVGDWIIGDILRRRH